MLEFSQVFEYNYRTVEEISVGRIKDGWEIVS